MQRPDSAAGRDAPTIIIDAFEAYREGFPVVVHLREEARGAAAALAALFKEFRARRPRRRQLSGVRHLPPRAKRRTPPSYPTLPRKTNWKGYRSLQGRQRRLF